MKIGVEVLHKPIFLFPLLYHSYILNGLIQILSYLLDNWKWAEYKIES